MGCGASSVASEAAPLTSRDDVKDGQISIIGITGTIGAGKGTVVEYLQKPPYNYKHYSARAYLNKIIAEKKLPPGRDSMRQVANELRAAKGPAALIEALYEEAIQVGENAIIESVRTEGEVKSLRSKGRFTLLAVDADQKIRYDRVTQRKSSTDTITFEKFQEQESVEMKSSKPNEQNLSRCIELADYKLDNSGTFEEFHAQIQNVLKTIASAAASSDAKDTPVAAPAPAPAPTLDPSKYRVRVVSFSLPDGGWDKSVQGMAEYLQDGVPAFQDMAAVREVMLTSPAKDQQFIMLFFEAKGEEKIKESYGKDPEDPVWQQMQKMAVEAGCMETPVQFQYMDASALFAGSDQIVIPDPGQPMNQPAGWPYGTMEGAIVQYDCPVDETGKYQGIRRNK